ncbi:hypothetical protein HNP84_003480 [Thermocatellispora tengchongensis]|uniref:Transcription regulator HTH AraC N-terminal domain-containing protein n=1 Tax=Thermocatellispora tengchongensis TaxID=1073253 RepID=A0A840NY00_9ACTN|nr:AraC family transcriptional regulator N-terminal domain-containing protein [Thermocatellispora tengchongensis]MBB5133754.1 hypothetical protein [Thermocatellispora tengchongensis]
MTADLLDAAIRLVRLLDRPRDQAVLAPANTTPNRSASRTWHGCPA